MSTINETEQLTKILTLKIKKMKTKNEKNGLIESIIRIPGLKRFVFGSCFSKGDYMPEDAPTFWVRVFGEKSFEVGRDKLLSFSPGRKKVTEPYLDTFKGKDANILR